MSESSGVRLLGGWYYRLIESFGYERQGYDILWRMPMYFSMPGGQSGKMLDEAFDEYRQTRGQVLRSSVEGRTFLKCTSEGFVFIDRLLADGDLREASINDLSSWWTGRWTVTTGVDQDGWLEQSDSGFFVTNIAEYDAALFLDESSGILGGSEHGGHRDHVFVWMGDVSKDNALQAVLNHVPPESRERARKAVSAFLA